MKMSEQNEAMGLLRQALAALGLYVSIGHYGERLDVISIYTADDDEINFNFIDGKFEDVDIWKA